MKRSVDKLCVLENSLESLRLVQVQLCLVVREKSGALSLPVSLARVFVTYTIVWIEQALKECDL